MAVKRPYLRSSLSDIEMPPYLWIMYRHEHEYVQWLFYHNTPLETMAKCSAGENGTRARFGFVSFSQCEENGG